MCLIVPRRPLTASRAAAPGFALKVTMTLAWVSVAAGPAAPTPVGPASAAASAPTASARLPRTRPVHGVPTDSSHPLRGPYGGDHSRPRSDREQEAMARARTGLAAAPGTAFGRLTGREVERRMPA